MISHLQTADIVIDLKHGIPAHAMVYRHRLTDQFTKEKISRGHQLYHAVYENDERVLTTTLRANLQGSLVFRLRNSELIQNLMQIVSEWLPHSPSYTKTTSQIIPFNAKQKTPTNLDLFHDNSTNNVIHFVPQKPVIPYAQFVGYSLKAAILKTLYPLGVPADVVRMISNPRSANAYLQFLNEPIKEKNMQDFTQLIQHEKYKSIFSLVGSLGFVRESEALDPIIVTPPGLAELPTKNLMLTPEHLATLETTTFNK